MYAFWVAIGIFVFILINEFYELVIWLFRTKENFNTVTEGMLDYPNCLNSVQLDNYIKEEDAMRTKFGYKRMFDSTLKIMKLTWDVSDTIEYHKKLEDHGLTDVASYDPCHIPDYSLKFYYVPFGERKYKRSYNELNEIRRVLDYPYYYESIDIDDIFNIPKDLWVSKNKSKVSWMTVDLRHENPEISDFSSKDRAPNFWINK